MPRRVTNRRPRRPTVQAPAQAVELAIERLGRHGDGIGSFEGQPAYVAFALPGERVAASLTARRGDGWQARLDRVIAASPHRIAPACVHFGRCGGCALQHLDPTSYRAFKQARVSEALRRAGLGDDLVQAPIVTPPASRRRITVTASLAHGVVTLGFNEAASHRIVDVTECPVAEPRLVALLAKLRELARALARPALDFSLLAVADGVDLLVRAEDAPNLADREILARFADSQDLARLAWQQGGAAPEPIAARRQVLARFGGIAVDLPPGGFLQATACGERAIVDAVLAHLAAAPPGPVADYFAGSGTISLPIAQAGRIVHAVDGDAAALAALGRAARAAGLALTTELRDIERRPPSGVDLDRYGALVFDPPRTGAAALARRVATSPIGLVIAVSCNPESFARDARTLCDGGYRLGVVQPIDQFLWSPHVELVAAFQR